MNNDKMNLGVTFLGESSQYLMFGARGNMQRLNRVHLAKGVKIYDVGAGLSTVARVVFDDNMHAVELYTGVTPDVVEDWEIESDDNAVITVEETARPISEKFGIGVYYADNEELITDDVVNASVKHGELVQAARDARRQEIQRAKVEAWEAATAEALTNYPYLERGAGYDYKRASKNVRTVLKRTFPGVAFRCHSGGSHDNFEVEWVDGPTKKTVSDALQPFRTAFCGDVYTDYFEYENTAFTALFGGFDYLHIQRTVSDELHGRLVNEHGEMWRDVFDKTDYTPAVAVAPAAPDVAGGSFEIVDYSEKAIAVVGDTKLVKDMLKQLGGRFNPRLTCGAGWIFPKTKESQLRASLGL